MPSRGSHVRRFDPNQTLLPHDHRTVGALIFQRKDLRVKSALSVWSPGLCRGGHRPCDHERLLKLKIRFRPCRIKLWKILGWPAWNGLGNRRQICAWSVCAVRRATRVGYDMVQLVLVFGVEMRFIVGTVRNLNIGHDAAALNG